MTNTEQAHEQSDGLVQPRRQILIGLALVVVGSLLAGFLIKAGTNVLAGVGFVLVVSGLVLLGNGVVLRRRHDDSATTRSRHDGADRAGVLALVLAFLIPPAGILVAPYSPVQGNRAAWAGGLAIPVGAILTVIYTFFLVLGAAFMRT